MSCSLMLVMLLPSLHCLVDLGGLAERVADQLAELAELLDADGEPLVARHHAAGAGVDLERAEVGVDAALVVAQRRLDGAALIARALPDRADVDGGLVVHGATPTKPPCRCPR